MRPSSSAARMAQPGSDSCRQSEKRHFRASVAMSANTPSMPASASASCSSRMPGVSSSQPPAFSRCRERPAVVWRPWASCSRMPLVTCAASRSSVFTSVDYDPVNKSDPNGHVIETLWDLFNAGLGWSTAYENLSQGNYGAAAVDVVGAIIDSAAIVAPGVPGGVSSGTKAYRGIAKLNDAWKAQPDVDKIPAGTLGRYWNVRVEFRGVRIYQRDDLIDLSIVDSRGRTNLQRMEKGLAPVGPDSESIELHHMLQMEGGPLAEVTGTFHRENKGPLHINPPSMPGGIDRSDFDKWRADYWRERARALIEEMSK